MPLGLSAKFFVFMTSKIIYRIMPCSRPHDKPRGESRSLEYNAGIGIECIKYRWFEEGSGLNYQQRELGRVRGRGACQCDGRHGRASRRRRGIAAAVSRISHSHSHATQ